MVRIEREAVPDEIAAAAFRNDLDGDRHDADQVGLLRIVVGIERIQRQVRPAARTRKLSRLPPLGLVKVAEGLLDVSHPLAPTGDADLPVLTGDPGEAI